MERKRGENLTPQSLVISSVVKDGVQIPALIQSDLK